MSDVMEKINGAIEEILFTVSIKYFPTTLVVIVVAVVIFVIYIAT